MSQQYWPRRAGTAIWRQARRAPVFIRVVPTQIPHARPFSPLFLAYGFAVLIFIGTILLFLPISQNEGSRTSFLEAFFTATSAVTVTGLIIVDTSTHWSNFGKAVLLVLIQMGGLGFMTSSILILIALGHRITLRERLLIKESLNVPVIGGITRLVWMIALMTFVIEAVGALLLLSLLRFDYPLDTAAWQSVFHSISAFNNSGFTILPDSDSMSKFRTETGVLVVIAVLVMMGGVGYTVLADLFRERRFGRFSLDTKMVLTISLALWAFVALIIFITEYNKPGTFGPLSVPDKLMNSFFFSTSARSSGFSTVDVGAMQEHTLFFLTFAMLIGAASGSTGGGVKVNTIGVVFFAVLNTIRGKEQVEAFHREIPKTVIYKAVTLLFFAFNLAAFATLLLIIMEGGRFIGLLFESVSAVFTVGLTTGITSDLSLKSTLLLIAMMFIGRVGPLTLVFALAQRTGRERIHYAEESVKIG